MVIVHEILDEETINYLCSSLRRGFCILIKTDTQWGLMALDPTIIYNIKRRPLDKKIIKLVGPNFKLGNLSEPQKAFIRKFWPGSVTIITNGEAFRLTNKKFINILINKLGSMVYCSSANTSGAEPINSIEEALAVFSHDLDKIIMVAPTREQPQEQPELANNLPALPSTIVDIDYWYIVRKGSKYLEVLDFIANYIIPYYKNHRKEYEKYVEDLRKINVSSVPEYYGTPIIELVRGSTNKIKNHRNKNKK